MIKKIFFLIGILVRRILIVVGLAYLLISTSVHAQPRFYKIIAGLGVKNNYDVRTVASSDGGWVTGGTTDSGIKLVKYDKCGVILWSKTYAGVCMDIIASKFGGYVITCTWPQILRIDENGNVIFVKNYSSPAYANWTYSIGEDHHGNLFISGITLPCGSCNGSQYTIKTDSLGTILWSKTFANSNYWTMALVCSDGGVLRQGGYGDIYKVDSSGNVEWAKYYYTFSEYKPIEVSDGYIFASHKFARSNVYKIDLEGNLLWSTSQYLTPGWWVHRITVAANGNVIAANNNFLIEFNSSGKYLKHNYFKNPVTGVVPHITDVCTLNGGSYIISGFDSTQSFNIRTASSLRTRCSDIYVPLDTIAPYVAVIRDTVYTSANYSFTTSGGTYSPAIFNPLENIICSTSDSLELSVIPDFVCSGQSLTLSATAGNDSDIHWCHGGCNNPPFVSGSSVVINPVITETYYVKAEGCDTSDCKAITVNVKPQPVAAFDIAYTMHCEGLTIDLTNESTNANTYLWHLNDGFTSDQQNISHNMESTPSLTISLIAINDDFCRDTVILQNNMSSFTDYLNVLIPNVFTPNNDGVNDDFEIIANCDISECFSITIFDRWGIELYSSRQYNSKWDGRTNAGVKAVPGTYFYLLNINDIEYKGEITLLE